MGRGWDDVGAAARWWAKRGSDDPIYRGDFPECMGRKFEYGFISQSHSAPECRAPYSAQGTSRGRSQIQKEARRE